MANLNKGPRLQKVHVSSWSRELVTDTPLAKQKSFEVTP